MFVQLLLLAAVASSVAAFHSPGSLGGVTSRRHDMRVFWFGGGNKAKDDWKEEAFREQQRILRERQENGGFIRSVSAQHPAPLLLSPVSSSSACLAVCLPAVSEEAEQEISARRRKLMVCLV